MTTSILFAVETIKTTQGWFEPGHLLPGSDMPDQEIADLLDEKKIGMCSYDSPMAALVREARNEPNKSRASELLKGALSSVSAESPPTNQVITEPPPPLETDAEESASRKPESFVNEPNPEPEPANSLAEPETSESGST